MDAFKDMIQIEKEFGPLPLGHHAVKPKVANNEEKPDSILWKILA